MNYTKNPNYIAAKARMKDNLRQKVQAPLWTGEMQKEPSISKAIVDQLRSGNLFIWSKHTKQIRKYCTLLLTGKTVLI